MTFSNPEVEKIPEREETSCSMEPSVMDLDTWLEWKSQQLDSPTWWVELEAIPGTRDLHKFARKIRASFYIPEVQMRASLEEGYTTLPAPWCLNWNAFLPKELVYQDVQQQPALLTITYARSLQYWAEKCKLRRNLDFHSLAESVKEL